MSTLEMKEIIKTKIDTIQDQELLNKIDELLKTEKKKLTADELFNFTASRYENTLKRLAE